jgi:hypothetical protein
VDLTTDNEGRLSEQQKQEYKACMKHEYAVYKELLAENHCAHGIPAVYGTGESLGWLYARSVQCVAGTEHYCT